MPIAVIDTITTQVHSRCVANGELHSGIGCRTHPLPSMLDRHICHQGTVQQSSGVMQARRAWAPRSFKQLHPNGHLPSIMYICSITSQPFLVPLLGRVLLSGGVLVTSSHTAIFPDKLVCSPS